MSAWTWSERKEARERDSIPAWVPLGDDDPDFKRIWVEDDARPPDGESGTRAWERIFDEPMLQVDQIGEYDGGDCTTYLYRGNRVYDSAPEGVSIWQYLPPRKFE